MTLKRDLGSVWASLCRFSPIVVDVPPEIRHVLLQRYMDMSMRNGRLSLVSFAILMFGMAYEAPLGPRIAAWFVLAAVYCARVWRSRVMLARLDEYNPKSDPAYDLMLVVASSVWGVAPYALQPWLSKENLFAVEYATFISIALLGITYVAALPTAFVLVALSAVPLMALLSMQGSFVLAVLAIGTGTCTIALLLRVNSSHGILLQALAAERQNARLVDELQGYRRVLESENATLDHSLRAAARAAHRDPLTGLFNRRHIVEFARPIADAVRAGKEAVTVCMVDVDHFKKVNDTHGHPVGDDVLRAVGTLLGARLRDGDCLARIGGEEFIVVLRDCDVARGRRVAEALRHNVAASQILTTVGEVPITVSLGVAQWASDESFDDVIERADRALYGAKHSGRDRVEIDDADLGRIQPGLDFVSSGPLH